MGETTRLESLIERAGFLFPAVPAIIYWFSWAFYRNYWFTTDPAAWYFLDSLSIFAGKSYVYVDHPGTPVHMIGSILLALTYPFFGDNASFIRYHIAEPETFFILANMFLLAANVLTMIVFYKTAAGVLQHNKILAATALSLMYFAIHPASFSSLTYWSHNSFNFIFGTLWLLWLFRELQTEHKLERQRIILLGITIGMIITTQLYLVAWLAGGIVSVFTYAIRRGQSFQSAIMNALIMAGSSLAGIVLMLLPIYHELPRLLDWLVRLIGRDGLYGAGAEGVYSPHLLVETIGYWWQNIPLTMLTLTILIISLAFLTWFIRSRTSSSMTAGDFAFAIGLLAQTIILFLILSKMYYRVRYVLSLAALLPVLFMVTVKLFEYSRLMAINNVLRVVYIGIIVSAFFNMSKEIRAQEKKTNVERESAVNRSQVVTRLAKIKNVSEEDIVTVYAFGTPFKCAGLLLANNWVHTFDTEIRERCPNQYAIYDFAYNVELNVPRPIASIETINWDLVVWPGNGSDLPEYLESAGGKIIPKSWHIKYGKWFYIHSQLIPE